MTVENITISLADAQATEQCGRRLASLSVYPVWYYFSGPLGSGKTTLISAFLRHLGVTDIIKSPSFSIVEPYTTSQGDIYHFDFYRLTDPMELEAIGWWDYFHSDHSCLVEWPEHGGDILPEPDVYGTFSFARGQHMLHLSAHREKGLALLGQLNEYPAD